MLLNGSIEQYGGKTFLMGDKPGAARAAILWEEKCACHTGMGKGFLRPRAGLFLIPAGRKIKTIADRYIGYCAHARLFLRVDGAMP